MSVATDNALKSTFDRIVAPVCTNLVRPRYVERGDANDSRYFTTFDMALWLDTVSYPLGAPPPSTDNICTHESGHCFAQHLGRWYPNGWGQALVDFLAYHGASIAPTDNRLWECFAEHFAAALGQGFYLQYPAYAGLVPFRSSADTLAWITGANQMAEAWAMARMIPRVVQIDGLDANGDTPKPAGVLIGNVSGLKPGIDAQGVCTRVGFVGSELGIGDFTFVTDKASQAFGTLHVRGAKGGSTIFVMLSAYQ